MKRGAALSAVVIIVAFCLSFFLFVKPNAPLGAVVDFTGPSGNFTGTTTFATSFGYECTASHVSGAREYVSGTTTTLTGVGVQCYPERFGYLQVPTGPGIILFWLVAFVVVIAVWAFYFRAPRLTTKIIERSSAPPAPA